jgi:type IV pilus assembly protein PilW
MKSVALRSRARGFSLIEILISLVIGLVVVGAVVVSIIDSGKAGRYQAAYAQMNEDAQIGLSILSRDLQMAGYAQPTGQTTSGSGASLIVSLSSNTLGTSTPVFGCDTGFADPRATPLVCGTTATPAFEVVYEADARNTVPTGGGVPSDCLGNSIPVGPPYVAHNRYFISAGNSGRPELYCASDNTANTPQPLIENIESMQVRYGTSVLASPTQVVRYVTATEVAGQGAAEWARVISVRVCLLVRSAEPVLNPGDDTVAYRDCSGALVTPTDRYLRRAYFTTAAVRDKMP